MKRDLPPLAWLRAFEATGRHLSFTKAAEELNVTPSALSHQVRQLEDMLGQKLFVRLNRAIELTEAGQRCHPGLRSGFNLLADAMAQLRPAVPPNRLVVGTGPAFAAKWLAPRLYRFVDAHPDLDLRIAASLAVTSLGEQGLDVAIRFGRGNYQDVTVEKLLDEAIAPMCSPAFLEQHPMESPADLEKVQLLHDDSMRPFPGLPGWEDWARAAGVPNLNVDRGLRFNHADHGLDAAMEGAGIVMGRRTLSVRDLNAGRLVMPFDISVPVRNAAFWLIYPTDEQGNMTAKVSSFRDWIHEEIAAEPLPF
ncbi:transcriptional regulator GcvA [Tepidamorphus sp. 3E244]|uniref:transcriptional regulator GcvA n=1 Tax=Tepidamorphus sp. 3E244 TaxID=3385498 RepID=UPI0038FBF9C6